MGLRIGQSQGVLSSLRSLQQNAPGLTRSLEKLATGLGINRASDNPAGLVISELLRAQIGDIGQAIENTQTDINLVNTADAALSEVGSILNGARQQVLAAMNTGVVSPQARAAGQEVVNNALSAINRISATTRFGSQNLLNGAADFTTENVDAAIQNADVFTANFDPGATLSVNAEVTQAADVATAGTLNAGGQVGAATIQIRGELGSAEVNLSGGETQAQVAEAINALTPQTGVEVSGAMEVVSSEVGSAAFVEINNVTGALTGVAEGYTEGVDIQGTVNGQTAAGNRETLRVAGTQFSGEITFASGTGPGNYGFDVTGGGLRFQIGTQAAGADRVVVGVGSVDASTLGDPGGIGALSSLAAGGANDLSNNPGQALQILDQALSQIGAQRGRLGAVSQQTLESSRNSLEVARENLVASESTIRDLDFAQGVVDMTRNRLLQDAGISVLRQSLNLQRNGIQQLLGI